MSALSLTAIQISSDKNLKLGELVRSKVVLITGHDF